VKALVPRRPLTLCPALVAAAGDNASVRFLEFFASNIRNAHTRRAYRRAAEDFLDWCFAKGVVSIADVKPLHIASVPRRASSSNWRPCGICSTGW
jgi:hypothetical protein